MISNSFRRCFIDVPIIVMALLSTPSHALTLLATIDQARTTEPNYLTGKTELDVYRARQRQALGGLLPQVSVTSNVARNNRDSVTESTPFSDGVIKENYKSASAQLNVTQPLLRVPNSIALRQSDLNVSQAEYKLEGMESELIDKVTSAWLDRLTSRDAWQLSRLQLAWTKHQWEVLSRGVKLGINSLPQADEALLKYEQAVADLEVAESDQAIKKAALEQLSGPLEDENWPELRSDTPDYSLKIEPLEKWISRVESTNHSILAAQLAFLAAKAEMDKQYAGHLPTLDMVASYGKIVQGAGTSPGQSRFDSNQWSIGLQLNLSLYSGGTQAAKVNEALAMQERARLELESTRRNTILLTRQAWYGARAAEAKMRAARQQIAAAQTALNVATLGVAKGIKTELDIIQAQQQKSSAQRDLNKACYEKIAAYVKLHAVAGTLGRDTLMALDQMFTGNGVIAK